MADDLKTNEEPQYCADQPGVSLEELCTAVQVSELCTALERLGAPPDLLAKAAALRDGLADGEVLALLRIWNANGKIVLDEIPPVR